MKLNLSTLGTYSNVMNLTDICRAAACPHKMRSELEIKYTSCILRVPIKSNNYIAASNCIHNSSPNSFGFISATGCINALTRHHDQHVCFFLGAEARSTLTSSTAAGLMQSGSRRTYDLL